MSLLEPRRVKSSGGSSVRVRWGDAVAAHVAKCSWIFHCVYAALKDNNNLQTNVQQPGSRAAKIWGRALNRVMMKYNNPWPYH